jgi:FixJ family two-component response regulator
LKKGRIRVKDSGRGIAKEIIPQLGTKGFTYGKEKGLGLGLHHAKTHIEDWGGDLQIESQPGWGTCLTIFLPLTSPPGWFVPEITVKKDFQIVVVDDDPSIHQVWQRRFEPFKEIGVSLRHFSTPEEFIQWYQNSEKGIQDILYLIDFEFVGSAKTGFDIIQELKLNKKALLVTSRFEELQFKEVKIIPKSQANFVPIKTMGSSYRIDAVLLDDDPLVREGWKIWAKKRGKEFQTVGSIVEFTSIKSALSKKTPIFIDSSLGEGQKGEDFAKELFQEGFNEIYLATGYPASYFEDLVGIKKVVSKDPPTWLWV